MCRAPSRGASSRPRPARPRCCATRRPDATIGPGCRSPRAPRTDRLGRPPPVDLVLAGPLGDRRGDLDEELLHRFAPFGEGPGDDGKGEFAGGHPSPPSGAAIRSDAARPLRELRSAMTLEWSVELSVRPGDPRHDRFPLSWEAWPPGIQDARTRARGHACCPRRCPGPPLTVPRGFARSHLAKRLARSVPPEGSDRFQRRGRGSTAARALHRAPDQLAREKAPFGRSGGGRRSPTRATAYPQRAHRPERTAHADGEPVRRESPPELPAPALDRHSMDTPPHTTRALTRGFSAAVLRALRRSGDSAR